MTTGLVWDERYAWHDAGPASQSRWMEPFPALDRPEGKRRIHNLVGVSGLMDELVPIRPRAATAEELGYFHERAYIDKIRELSDAGGGEAGEAARFGPGGFEIASLAAGGAIVAMDAVLGGRVDNAYALVRPCGHHAEANRGRGFCIFNNIVVAIEHARKHRGVGRVAVIDWDVHHGNGIEDAFYDDPNVLTISLHQERYYPPERGASDEYGAGAGAGYNVNVPLPPGSGHGAYAAAFDRVVAPSVSRMEPELIVVASGFDGAMSDPLGRMLCYTETYRYMTRQVLELARRHAGGRLVLCHEGGYSPTYAPFCGLAVLEELAGERTPVEDPLAGWYAAVGGAGATARPSRSHRPRRLPPQLVRRRDKDGAALPVEGYAEAGSWRPERDPAT